MLTRRAFLQTTAAVAGRAQSSGPKRIAIVTTVHRYLSHGQHIGDRFLVGYPYAGASLPVTWRLPELELPLGCHIHDALMIGVGGSDAMDYHALEAMQCMVERRGRGETGVRAVQMIEGDAVWKASEEGRWSKELL